MNWKGILLGGGLGFMVGGPLGAVLGAVLGHHVERKGREGLAEALPLGQQQRVQTAFFTAAFSVMGRVAKADGRVSEKEIALASAIMDHMNLDPNLRRLAIDLFNQGKAEDFPLDDVLEQFRRECHRRDSLLVMFLSLQVQTAFADGRLDAAEEAVLRHIAGRLGFSAAKFEEILRRVAAEVGGFERQTGEEALASAYAILGLEAGAGDAEVKQAYRRLISQNHPDRLVSKGLPEEMITLANEKTAEVRKAYETIRAARKGEPG